MGTISYFDLNQYISQYNTQYFFETGTLYGDGVDYALKFPFTKIYSAEIMPELATKAIEKYKNNSKVEILEGHSGDILTEYVDKLDKNTVFWLDAHFPGADANLCSYNDEEDINKRAPLKVELEAIQKRTSKYKDVIIIDDLRCYEDCPELGSTFDSHMQLIGKRGEGCTREKLIGINSDFIYTLFKGTHNINKIFAHEGYYVLTPL
jgi:hypothetical protein